MQGHVLLVASSCCHCSSSSSSAGAVQRLIVSERVTRSSCRNDTRLTPHCEVIVGDCVVARPPLSLESGLLLLCFAALLLDAAARHTHKKRGEGKRGRGRRGERKRERGEDHSSTRREERTRETNWWTRLKSVLATTLSLPIPPSFPFSSCLLPHLLAVSFATAVIRTHQQQVGEHRCAALRYYEKCATRGREMQERT